MGRYGDIAVAGTGVVHLSYYDMVGDLRYASRTTGGVWSNSPAVTTNAAGTYSNICLNGSNVPQIAFYDSTTTDLLLATRQSNGAFTVTPIDVSATTSVGQYASMVCSGGQVFASYYDAGLAGSSRR